MRSLRIGQRGGMPSLKAPIHSVSTHEVNLPETHCFQNRCSWIFSFIALSSLGSDCPGTWLVMRSVDIGFPPVTTLMKVATEEVIH